MSARGNVDPRSRLVTRRARAQQRKSCAFAYLSFGIALALAASMFKTIEIDQLNDVIGGAQRENAPLAGGHQPNFSPSGLNSITQSVTGGGGRQGGGGGGRGGGGGNSSTQQRQQ
jgi:hypothetical protein